MRSRFVWPAMLLALGLSSAALCAADVYEPDLAHSDVSFKVKHLGLSTVIGHFTDYTGKAVFDKEAPDKSSVDVEVKATSVNTGNDKRDEHLRGADFFNVKEFPTLKFKSTSVKKIDDATYEITGNFTLLAVTKPITVQFTDVAFGPGLKGEPRAGGDIRFSIKRSDYGMSKLVGPVGDKIDIEMSFEATKAAAK